MWLALAILCIAASVALILLGIKEAKAINELKRRCGRCYTCEENTAAVGDFLFIRRMVLCEYCGNKRCPHATDCRLPCTGSNEPGQLGSRY